MILWFCNFILWAIRHSVDGRSPRNPENSIQDWGMQQCNDICASQALQPPSATSAVGQRLSLNTNLLENPVPSWPELQWPTAITNYPGWYFWHLRSIKSCTWVLDGCDFSGFHYSYLSDWSASGNELAFHPCHLCHLFGGSHEQEGSQITRIHNKRIRDFHDGWLMCEEKHQAVPTHSSFTYGSSASCNFLAPPSVTSRASAQPRVWRSHWGLPEVLLLLRMAPWKHTAWVTSLILQEDSSLVATSQIPLYLTSMLSFIMHWSSAKATHWWPRIPDSFLSLATHTSLTFWQYGFGAGDPYPWGPTAQSST